MFVIKVLMETAELSSHLEWESMVLTEFYLQESNVSLHLSWYSIIKVLGMIFFALNSLPA